MKSIRKNMESRRTLSTRMKPKIIRKLKMLAASEDKKVADLLEELVEDYFEAHRETLDLLSIPGFYEHLLEAESRLAKGEEVSLDEVEDDIRQRTKKISK